MHCAGSTRTVACGAMPRAATTPPRTELRYTSSRYFALRAEGILGNDRVELLEGVIVAMSPESARETAGVRCAGDSLTVAVGAQAVIRVRQPLVAGAWSVPEPDVAVVAGLKSDHVDTPPTAALLVVEVSDTTLVQDRLTKATIYAAAGVPEYWLVNVRDGRVEVFRRADRLVRHYGEQFVAGHGSRLELRTLPGVGVAVDDLLHQDEP